jgi:hypothetical protein
MKLVRLLISLLVLLLLGITFIFSNSHLLDTVIVGIVIAYLLNKMGLLGSNKDMGPDDDFIDTDFDGDSDD